MDAPTLQRLRIPSRDFWTITPFTIATPDGWTAEQTVEHLVYARSGDGSANVSVRWSRVPGALGLEQVATVGFANILRIDKAARVVMTGYGRHRGLRSYLRLVEFTPERGERRGQCYLALNGPNFGSGRPIELFELTGHFAAGDTARLREIEAMIASFQFALEADGEDDHAAATADLDGRT